MYDQQTDRATAFAVETKSSSSTCNSGGFLVKRVRGAVLQRETDLYFPLLHEQMYARTDRAEAKRSERTNDDVYGRHRNDYAEKNARSGPLDPYGSRRLEYSTM